MMKHLKMFEDDDTFITTIKMVVMSHLSDAQEEANGNKSLHINFAKFLIMKYNDLSKLIDPEKEWKEFIKRHPPTK